jgi:ribulose-5-phosphate 4-epimerase/fuculose-1-phosphate aldolase
MTHPPADLDLQMRHKLIAAGNILDAADQGDLTRGHVSVRVPGDPMHFYMKPHSQGLDEITPENIVLCNLAGEKVGGGGRRHSEVFIHSEVYKLRPDVMSVIHVHPTHAVALSATGRALLPISQPSVAFCSGSGDAQTDGVPYFTGTIDLIRTPEMGAAVARALGGCKAAFLRNHGVVVVGASLEESTVLSLLLEEACRIQLLVQASGGVGEMFAADNIAKLHHNITRPEQYTINFDYLRRRVSRGHAF